MTYTKLDIYEANLLISGPKKGKICDYLKRIKSTF